MRYKHYAQVTVRWSMNRKSIYYLKTIKKISICIISNQQKNTTKHSKTQWLRQFLLRHKNPIYLWHHASSSSIETLITTRW